jgi:hypothetical protein
MELKEIMSVSGQGGLFKFISQGRNGIIVESFTDKKRSFVNASSKVSSLEDIAIFTHEEEVPLKKVFKNIFDLNNGNPAPDSKETPDKLKAFMEKILPDYDQDRVYMSDIKKLFSWYNTLLSLDMIKFDEEIPANNTPEEDPEKKAEPVKKKKAPAKSKTSSAKQRESSRN